jgi:hypothetical protein
LCGRQKIKLKTARSSNIKKHARAVRAYKKNFGVLAKDYAPEDIEFEDEMCAWYQNRLGAAVDIFGRASDREAENRLSSRSQLG